MIYEQEKMNCIRQRKSPTHDVPHYLFILLYYWLVLRAVLPIFCNF